VKRKPCHRDSLAGSCCNSLFGSWPRRQIMSVGELPQQACIFASCEGRNLTDKLRECPTRNESMRR
jgi:hypothetical protein